jgi:hypothetical protein
MLGNLQNRLYILFPPLVVSLTTTHFSLSLLLLLLHRIISRIVIFVRVYVMCFLLGTDEPIGVTLPVVDETGI